MSYDEGAAERVREIMQDIPGCSEKTMFGGIAFMINGNMCAGIVKHELMLRVGPILYDEMLMKRFVRKMDFTGKPMKGLVYIEPDGFSENEDLKGWIDGALLFVNSLPAK